MQIYDVQGLTANFSRRDVSLRVRRVCQTSLSPEAIILPGIAGRDNPLMWSGDVSDFVVRRETGKE
jgi:hypothetical protein